jgi:hypothetical protein
MARWDVGFSSAGGDVPQRTKNALLGAGHDYWIYDTGKIVNILLQVDGNRLCHFEHPALLHIGGMSHYLSPPEKHGGLVAADEDPDQRWPWPTGRLEVARHTAALLRALVTGDPPPAAPAGVRGELGARLDRVSGALVELVRAYDAERDPA